MNYYNEIDPAAAAWLAALMGQKLIPHGHIDTRSICDVTPAELKGYTQCHFFAGIGGWSLALKLAGWPESRPVWTGSCPCQPFSDAGKGLGEADPRHLWPYFRNLIGNCRPAVVFGEQVGSKAGRLWLSRVRSDFQSAAYAFGAADLAAASLGAPHKRQRLFWVADSELRRPEQRNPGERPVFESHPSSANGRMDDTAGARLQPEGQRPEGETRDQARLRRPERRRTVSSRLGNAILPGLEGYAGNGADRSEPGRLTPGQARPASEANTHAFWRDTRWIPTTDPRTGKTVMRRIPVEPSLFPLVARLPGRVGILRGAGNAIVPQVAQIFIEAYLATL